MKVGYYFAKSAAYGNGWPAVSGFTNVFMDFELNVTGLPTLGPGHKLWFDLFIKEGAPYDSPAYIKKTLTALKPYWNRVMGISLSDEPNWSKAEVNKKAVQVKALISELGLAPKPVGIVLTSFRVLNTAVCQAAKLDWIGIEGYIDYIEGESPAGAAARVTALLTKQIAKVPATKKIMLIASAFDRNGVWKNIKSLVAIQEPVFKAAKKLGKRLLSVALFSYKRKGGTEDHPELLKEHKRLRKVYP